MPAPDRSPSSWFGLIFVDSLSRLSDTINTPSQLNLVTYLLKSHSSLIPLFPYWHPLIVILPFPVSGAFLVTYPLNIHPLNIHPLIPLFPCSSVDIPSLTHSVWSVFSPYPYVMKAMTAWTRWKPVTSLVPTTISSHTPYQSMDNQYNCHRWRMILWVIEIDLYYYWYTQANQTITVIHFVCHLRPSRCL